MTATRPIRSAVTSSWRSLRHRPTAAVSPSGTCDVCARVGTPGVRVPLTNAADLHHPPRRPPPLIRASRESCSSYPRTTALSRSAVPCAELVRRRGACVRRVVGVRWWFITILLLLPPCVKSAADEGTNPAACRNIPRRRPSWPSVVFVTPSRHVLIAVLLSLCACRSNGRHQSRRAVHAGVQVVVERIKWSLADRRTNSKIGEMDHGYPNTGRTHVSYVASVSLHFSSAFKSVCFTRWTRWFVSTCLLTSVYFVFLWLWSTLVDDS